MSQSQLQSEVRKKLLKRGILPLIEQDAHLEQILDQLIQNVEGQAEQMLAAVFFYNPAEKELTVGAAPNLQPSYKRAVNGFKIGPQQPACGSAVFRRTRVISTDVRVDPLWENYRKMAEDANVRAVWSEPIFDEAENVLGTLAFYFSTPKRPDSIDLAVLEAAAKLASLAIQCRRSQFVAMYGRQRT